MKCQRCHFKNSDEAYFCIKCGQKLYTAVLQQKDAAQLENTYYLLPVVYSIGRDASNEIVLNDSKVSRKHARIFFENNDFYICDLGSKNGVIVNDGIINRVKLTDSDIIQIGQDKFLFKHEKAQYPSEFEVEDYTIGPILKVLSRINQTFHGSYSLEEILHLILDSVVEFTRFQRGFLFVYDRNRMAKLKFTRNMNDPSFDDELTQHSATAENKAVTTGKIVFEQNVRNSAEFREQMSVINLRLMSLICIPIVSMHHYPSSEFGVEIGGRTILGVIYVDNQRSTEMFTERRLQVLQTLANQAALAVDNKLIRHERIEKNKLDKELELAHKIQQNLLPANPPESKHLDVFGINEPCKLIGGDYHDYFNLKDGKIGIVIADVCGKGAPAALLMSSLQATLKSQVQYIYDIEDILANLNSAMMQNAPSNRFITLFLAVYNPADRHLQYVSCGHDPAILLRAAGEIELLKSTGIPIGIQHPLDIRTKSVKLQPGDIILLYTDGVTEARNRDGAQFGLENLKKVFRKIVADLNEVELYSEDIIDGILENVYEFSEQTERRDDLTLVAIRPL